MGMGVERRGGMRERRNEREREAEGRDVERRGATKEKRKKDEGRRGDKTKDRQFIDTLILIYRTTPASYLAGSLQV